jgi:ASC-1-like (ASCH) protein
MDIHLLILSIGINFNFYYDINIMTMNETPIDFIIRLTNHYIGMIGGHKTYYKSVDNSPGAPWLDLIERGIKKFEGRVNVGDWKRMKIGDTIIFFNKSTTKQVKTIIMEFKYFTDFGAAFKELGQEFIPIKDLTVEGANKLSWKYYSKEFIKENGMVAVGIKLIK